MSTARRYTELPTVWTNVLAAGVLAGGALDARLSALFADPDVADVHLHNARPGCFTCRVERA